jgi:hypothetical protein
VSPQILAPSKTKLIEGGLMNTGKFGLRRVDIRSRVPQNSVRFSPVTNSIDRFGVIVLRTFLYAISGITPFCSCIDTLLLKVYCRVGFSEGCSPLGQLVTSDEGRPDILVFARNCGYVAMWSATGRLIEPCTRCGGTARKQQHGSQ